MGRFWLRAAYLLSVFIVSACGGASISLVPFQTLSAAPPPEVMPRDQDFGRLVNGIRRGDGLAPLAYNARLDRAAQGHATDMVRRGYFSHVSPEGEDVADRIRATGYRARDFGENIARGQQNNEQVLRDWQNSSSHNRLLRAPRLDEFGLGVAGSGADTRWVLVMARD